MEFEIIDRLYQAYKTNKYPIAQTILMSEYMSPGGGDALIELFNNYINANIGQLPNYFLSKEATSSQSELAKNIVDTMQNVAAMVDFYRIDLMMPNSGNDDFFEEESFEFEDNPYYRDSFVDSFAAGGRYNYDIEDDYDDVFEDTLPQQLFFISTDFMQEAFNRYCDNAPGVSPEGFEHVLNFINYVKSQNLISRVFMNNDISQMDFENVIISILDADKTIAENIYVEPLEFTARDVVGSDTELFDYFNYIKFGCEDIKDLPFQQYRSTFISRRGFNVDLDKLVFVRNYLEFIRTGVMPTPDGKIYFEADLSEKLESEREFAELYRTGFDNREFVNHQANYIFDINGAMLSPGKLQKFKSVKNDKSLSVGCLLSSNSLFCDTVHDDVYFLVHINIDDVTNNKSNYELQLNILPQAVIENRVQIVRFDNWKEEQTHRNLGNKLNTVTHIHLYNHLDLLRGKKNGAYDIAFNLTEDSTDFETALKVFMEFIVRDEELQNKLIKKVLKAKESAVLALGTGEMS